MDQPISAPKTGTKLWTIILIVVGASVVLGLIGIFIAGKLASWGYNRALELEEGVIKADFDEATGTGTGVFEDEEGNRYRVEARGEGESLPAGFPKDFPIMPGTENLESAAVKDLEQVQDFGFKDVSVLYTATWLTKKSVDEAFTFYRSALKEKGWRVMSADKFGDVGTISFERINGSANGLLTIVPSETDPGQTEIGTLIGVK